MVSAGAQRRMSRDSRESRVWLSSPVRVPTRDVGQRSLPRHQKGQKRDCSRGMHFVAKEKKSKRQSWPRLGVGEVSFSSPGEGYPTGALWRFGVRPALSGRMSQAFAPLRHADSVVCLSKAALPLCLGEFTCVFRASDTWKSSRTPLLRWLYTVHTGIGWMYSSRRERENGCFSVATSKSRFCLDAYGRPKAGAELRGTQQIATPTFDCISVLCQAARGFLSMVCMRDLFSTLSGTSPPAARERDTQSGDKPSYTERLS